MMPQNCLVSACLLGLSCRYDQKSAPNNEVLALKDKINLIPVCPEIYGGLQTPRNPAEIRKGKVYTKNGADVTQQYQLGAKETLLLAKKLNCKIAILKEKSPSCGKGKVYDGSFTRTLIEGNGIAAGLLMENEVSIYGEGEISKLIKDLGI